MWLVTFVPPASAALQVRLDDAGLTFEQQRASQQLLDAVVALLPPPLIVQLDREVTLRWSSRLPDDVMGRARFGDQILVNRRWLDALVQGDANAFPAERQHGTLQRELQATLIHELAHFYDQGRFWSNSQRQLVHRCDRQRSSTGPIGLPAECLGQAQRRFTLGDDPRLLELAGWPLRVGGRGEIESQNNQYLRSPDPYELSNPREFVAVNLEYYLLDHQYRCRRPALHDFFQEYFNWAPPESAGCAEGYSYINAGLDPDRPALGRLDPERIYQVHYLLAEPSDAWVSRWGHSMLRVVICAPGRPRGPACLMDLEHHLVLSFRAFVGDVQQSSWDGLTGAYPSRLFLLPLQQVVEEYTKVELRSLQSLPLRLTRDEQIALVERAVELHWSYDGTYYFVSNNCAVETLKLLRSGTNRAEMRQVESVTPTGLLALLQASGVVDDSVLQDRREAQRQGFYFDSYRERYRLMFDVVRERLAVPQERVEDWLDLSARERQPWIALADRRAAAAMLLLEQAAFRRLALQALHDLKERYLSRAGSTDVALEEVGELMGQLLKDSGFLSRPASLLESGYGLPQQVERLQLRRASDDGQQGLLAVTEMLDARALELLSNERRAEIIAGEHNLARLRRRLQQLHRDAGGLVLP